MTLMVALCGCSIVLRGEDDVQCRTDADCAAYPGAACVAGLCRPPGGGEDAGADSVATGPWSCVDNPAPPPDGGSVSFTLIAYNPFASSRPEEAPIADVAARACTRLDPDCRTPTATGLKTDAGGRVTFALPASFDGFFELTAANYMPLLFFSPSAVQTGAAPAAMYSPTAFGTVASLAGADVSKGVGPSATFGHVTLVALDCQGGFARGVAWSAERVAPETKQYYLVDGAPNTLASETEGEGIAGFINMPLGYVVMNARRASDNRSLGRANVLVRPGGITLGGIGPR